MLGKIIIEGEDEAGLEWLDPNKLNLVAEVSTKVCANVAAKHFLQNG